MSDRLLEEATEKFHPASPVKRNDELIGSLL